MSLLRMARDLDASFYYGRRLEVLRERHLERSLNGEQLSKEYWEAGEREVLELTRREYFNSTARDLFFPPGTADSVSDDEDFAQRSTQLAEAMALDAHRALAAIPWVGHANFDDDATAGTGDTGSHP